MPAYKECVAGYGHTTSLWFHFVENQMTGYTLETPKGCESMAPDVWFERHMLILRMMPKCGQKTNDVLPYLTFTAGDRAVQAIRDYNVYELAIAFTSHYCWQLVNGAKILKTLGELAKVYAGASAIYVFRSHDECAAALRAVNQEKA